MRLYKNITHISLVLSFMLLVTLASDDTTTTTDSIVARTDPSTPVEVEVISSINDLQTVNFTVAPGDITVSSIAEKPKEDISPKTDSFTTALPVEFSTLVSTLWMDLGNASHHKDLSSTTIRPESTTLDVLGKWRHFENLTKIFAKTTVKSFLPTLLEGAGKLNISESCRRDVLKWIIGIRDIKTWAFSFIDASGKFVDGMLSGTMATLGEYDQCLDIKAINDRRGKNFGQVMFTGQYCALDYHPPLPPKKRYYKINEVVEELKEFAAGDNIINEAAKSAQFFHFLTMRTGICVPSGCKPSDIQQIVDIVVNDIFWSGKVRRCEVRKGNEFTPLIICVMTSMCFFGFLLLVGSLIDLYHKYAEKKVNNLALEILVSFSLPCNFKKLVNMKNSKGSLSCLNGLRFLSISWIILGHTYLNVNYVLSKTLRNATIFQKDFFFQAIVNASVAVDTFFFIGGFLVCYVTVKVIRETRKPFSILLYILHRVFRLLPVYVMVIVFIYLAPILGSGPVFHDTVEPFLDSCYKNWWTNILFVNNFVNTDQICLPQSWYVACDMQLYIAALIVILPILRWPWVGLSIASLGIMASVAGSVAMTYFNEYPPTMLFIHADIEQRLAYWAEAYFKPYSHAGPYCIGLIVGYVLATHPKLKFSIITRVIGWCVAIACNMSVLYGVYEWNSGRDPELIETLLYSGLHRVAWTFGVAWIVLNCATGQGGVINYILSWRVWVPLGRLTYTVYLIHPIVQIAAVANVKVNVMTTHYFAVWIFFGHLMITIGSAFAASMLVEAPFISLEKLLLRSLTGKKPNQTTNGQETVTTNNQSTITNGHATTANSHATLANGHAVAPGDTSGSKTNTPAETTGDGILETAQENGTVPFSHL